MTSYSHVDISMLPCKWLNCNIQLACYHTILQHDNHVLLWDAVNIFRCTVCTIPNVDLLVGQDGKAHIRLWKASGFLLWVLSMSIPNILAKTWSHTKPYPSDTHDNLLNRKINSHNSSLHNLFKKTYIIHISAVCYVNYHTQEGFHFFSINRQILWSYSTSGNSQFNACVNNVLVSIFSHPECFTRKDIIVCMSNIHKLNTAITLIDSSVASTV